MTVMKTKTTPIPIFSAAMLGGAACCLADDPVSTLIDAPPPPPPGALSSWPGSAPDGCPFPQSDDFRGLHFTGRHTEYTGADTWYPSWAADGNLYSPWTDGNVHGLGCSSAGENAATGHATILGDDPLKLQVVDQAIFKSSPRPYEGRYPCGSLVHDGVWYYGTYCLHPSGGVRRDDGIIYNWPWLGPFVGFRWSTDFGKTWQETPRTPAKPLFGEHALNGEAVIIGAPHFVDFGKAMQHSPDGMAYLVGHGSSDGKDRRYAYNSWITADQVHMVRVKPSIENINDVTKYEFFAGHGPDGEPVWSDQFARIRPLAEWRDHMGCVTMTYNAPLKKFLMCVTDGGNTVSRYHTYLLESDKITGPWKMAAYLRNFGEQAYFVNIPSKFISGGGNTFWLCYSANFSSGWGGTTFESRPPGSRYAMCLQEVRLITPSDPVAPPGPLTSPANIAPLATVTVTSTHGDYSVRGLTDGVVGGYPGDISQEWCSNGERGTATIRLTWNEEQTIDRVWLFDRRNELDQIRSGLLVFSDGSTIPTGELPDDAKQGLQVKFPPKRVKWLVFIPNEVKPSTLNIGLAEIGVFRSH
jgi:hypothetical protein